MEVLRDAMMGGAVVEVMPGPSLLSRGGFGRGRSVTLASRLVEMS